MWSKQRDCQKQGLSMKRDKLKRWLQNKFCASIKREDNRFPVSSLTQVDPTGLTRSVGKIFHSYIFVNHQHCPSLMIWRKKRLVCLRKTSRVNFFYPFTRPEKLRRFPFFPLSNRINVFVVRSCLVNLIIVYLSSTHPPVTEGTYCEKIQKT